MIEIILNISIFYKKERAIHMKTQTILYLTLSGIALFLLGACSPSETPQAQPEEPEIDLLQTEDAAKFILSSLDLEAGAQVEVRLHAKILNPSDIIEEGYTASKHRVQNYEWFALVDKVPGAFLPHPMEYVFLDIQTQELTVTPRQYMPSLNGEPIWPDNESYYQGDDLIYSTIRPVEGQEGMLAFSAERNPLDTSVAEINYSDAPYIKKPRKEYPKRHFALLLYNFDEGPIGEDIRDNLKTMAEALKLNGYRVLEFVHEGSSGERMPYIHLGDKNGYSLFQIRNFVYSHDDENDVNEEIFIYYTGQTSKTTVGRKEQSYIELMHHYAGEKADRKPELRMYAEDLADLLSGLKSRHLNVVIDSNHSGGFIDSLLKVKSIESVATSCKVDEYSYSGVYDSTAGQTPDPYTRSAGERGSEFTSGFAKGLMDHMMTKSPDDDPLPPHKLVEIGFNAAVANDASAIAGATHPCAEFRIREDG